MDEPGHVGEGGEDHGVTRRAHQQAGPLSVSEMASTNQPSPSGLPGSQCAQDPSPSSKLRIVVGIDLVFHFSGHDGQALSLDPFPRFFALFFFEHWQVGMMPPTIRIAHNCYGLDQNSFFGHDCSFAAIAADFEGEGVDGGFGQPINFLTIRKNGDAEDVNYYQNDSGRKLHVSNEWCTSNFLNDLARQRIMDILKVDIEPNAALDDLQVIMYPRPRTESPGNQQVVLQNNNKSKSVIVNVQISCGQPYVVVNSSLWERNLFPRLQEIRIPAGGRVLLNETTIVRWVKVGADVGRSYLDVNFSILGAVYVADDPVPLPDAGEAENSLLFYKVKTDVNNDPNEYLWYAVNGNAVFSINTHVQSRPKHGLNYIAVGFELVPLEVRLFAQFDLPVSNFELGPTRFLIPVVPH